MIAFSSILAAMSIILGKYLSFTAGPFRISFENLPILMAGIFFGPIVGMIVGALADIVGCLLVGYNIIPIITVGAVLIGGISGSLYRIFRAISKKGIKLYISVLFAHIVGSMIVKSIGLAITYGYPFESIILRVPLYLVISFAEFYIIYLLMKNKSFMKTINETGLTGNEKKKSSNQVQSVTYYCILEKKKKK